jgi:phosphoribosylformylglycinamidine cyclo-ligase
MTEQPPKKTTYVDAGVDIDAGNALVERIKPFTRMTNRSGVMGGIGGFGGLFDLKAAGYGDNAVLVAATDGVGTKLKLAHLLGKHATIGIDLVAMCVNDLLAQGAEPLFFLDYFACGSLNVEVAAQVVEGIALGCKESGCALIGGETAEMPDMYQVGEYDLAGFAVGAVNRDAMLPCKEAMQEGDVLLGLASSGVHSNGYSLVRRLITQQGLRYEAAAPFDATRTLGEILLTPTRLYVASCLPLMRKNHGIHAFAHITGGGLSENIPRVLPSHLSAHIDCATWKLPPLFAWLQQAGNLDDADMLKTFNCGIGAVLVVKQEMAQNVMAALQHAGENVFHIGTLRQSDHACVHYQGVLAL